MTAAEIRVTLPVDAANAAATAATLRASGEQVFEIGLIADRADGAAVVVR